MYVISKDFTFCAAHRLPLSNEHPCSRPHGHNYVVRTEVSGELVDADSGMLIDYADLGPFRDYIDRELDHRDLNGVLDNPTAENLAKHLWVTLGRVVPAANALSTAIGVSETPACWAWYRP